MNSGGHEQDEKLPMRQIEDGETATALGVDCGEADGDDKPRVQWGSKMEFLLSTIGFAVDLSNVFRFPNTCYRNGGGAFLIPYFAMLGLCALPLFYMELILGQYNRQGCISIWNKVCPIMQGIGIASCIMNFYVALFYNSVIAWSFHYLFASFRRLLPWTLCNQTYNTPLCWNDAKRHVCESVFSNGTAGLLSNASQLFAEDFATSFGNASVGFENATFWKMRESGFRECLPTARRVSSAAEYFDFHVLGVQHSGGFSSVGPLKWDLTLCLALTFIILYFSLFKGVKSMGVAVWITALLPYIVLAILLVRGLMLPGALTGIKYFIRPEFEPLLSIEVWSAAAIQIFFSIGSGFGVHLAYASYNAFDNKILKDCCIVAAVNSFTSLFSGFVVFTYLGYMSHKSGMPIRDVVGVNSGLVFTVYPEALSTIPWAPFWSILFFVMLLTLGLDSSFGALEALLTAVTDEFKGSLRGLKYSREIVTGVACVFIYLCALPNVTYGGMYVYRFLEEYGAGVSILVAVTVQCLCVSWVYGLHNFSNDLVEMGNSRPSLIWRILWKFVTPAILLVLSVYSLTAVDNPLMQLSNGDEYVYPHYTKYFGWLVILSSIIFIPVFVLVKCAAVRARSVRERMALAISPSREHGQIRRTGDACRLQLKHWLKF